MYTYKTHRTRQREEAKFDAYTYIFGGDCIPTGVEGVTTYDRIGCASTKSRRFNARQEDSGRTDSQVRGHVIEAFILLSRRYDD